MTTGAGEPTGVQLPLLLGAVMLFTVSVCRVLSVESVGAVLRSQRLSAADAGGIADPAAEGSRTSRVFSGERLTGSVSAQD